MKKLLVVTPYFYPDKGGVSLHTYNLYKRLAGNKEYDITVLAAAKKDKEENIEGLKVVRFKYWKKISNSPLHPFWIFRIPNLIRSLKPDLILIHTPVPIMPDIAALFSGKIPYIIKYHHGGSMVKGKFFIDLLLRFYESTLLKYILKRSKVVISASSYVADNFLKDYRKNTIVITPGVDTKEFKPGIAKTNNKILCIASLNKAERYKGIDYLIEALQILKEKMPRIKLLLVGDGDFMPYYKKLARKLKVNENIIFYGRLGKERIRLFKECSMFVLPSLFESCPNVILEAMASGKPVAATKATGIPYLVDNGKDGILFAPADPSAIAESVLHILKNRKKATAMGRKGLMKVKKFYTWDRKVSETKDVIDRVLA